MTKEKLIKCLENYITCSSLYPNDDECKAYEDCKGCPYDDGYVMDELIQYALYYLKGGIDD